MTTTTDQRDELAKALQESIKLLKSHNNHMWEQAKCNKGLRGNKSDRIDYWLDYEGDSDTYNRAKKFIKEWKIK